MKPLSMLTALISLCILTALRASAQDAARAETPQTGVVLVKLSPPTYPPLARQARIMGDVKIQVLIRKDGAVESAEVISGHPILKQAALDSAQKSQFECRRCAAEVTSYSLTYAFALGGECRFGPNCEPVEESLPKVEQSPGRIAISAEPMCTCDPRATRIRVRSARCLYLWKCGLREVEAIDPLPARSPSGAKAPEHLKHIRHG